MVDGRWISLGREEKVALIEYRRRERGRSERLLLVADGDYAKLFSRSMRNAEVREVPFLLRRPEFDELVAEAHGKCQLTGIRFDTSRIEGARRRPFAPSLDRIRAGGAYERGNVRLICCAVNTALSDWGTAVLERVATSYYWHHRRRLRRVAKT